VNTAFIKSWLFTHSQVSERLDSDGQKRRRSARERMEITTPVQREEAWDVVHSVAGRHERFDTNLNFIQLTSGTNNGSAMRI
jgi:hypothetical protein